MTDLADEHDRAEESDYFGIRAYRCERCHGMLRVPAVGFADGELRGTCPCPDCLHRLTLCGVVCGASWHQPVACAFAPDHDGDHSWASIPAAPPGYDGDPPGAGWSALEQLQARRITELEAALRQYANPQHWGISRDDLNHRVVSWIGPGAEKAGMPDPMQIARDALGG